MTPSTRRSFPGRRSLELWSLASLSSYRYGNVELRRDDLLCPLGPSPKSPSADESQDEQGHDGDKRSPEFGAVCGKATDRRAIDSKHINAKVGTHSCRLVVAYPSTRAHC